VGGGEAVAGLVAVAVDDAVPLLVGVCDALKVIERDANGEFEMLGEALVVGVCVPLDALTKGAPTVAVAPGDKVAACDEVAVADALPVALAVWLPDGDTAQLEDMAAVAVPTELPSDALKSGPDPVGAGDALAALVDVAVEDEVALLVAVEVALRVIDLDATGVFDATTELLAAADASSPGELVGARVALADFVDVAVDLALLVELAVAVRVRFDDALTSGEREPLGDLDTRNEPLEDDVGVPCVPLNAVPLTSTRAPADPVGRGEREAWTEALDMAERDAKGDFDIPGEPLIAGLRVPAVTLVPSRL
jgi:hypothetical protein